MQKRSCRFADSVGRIAKHSLCVLGKPYNCTNVESVGRTVSAVDLGRILRNLKFYRSFLLFFVNNNNNGWNGGI